MVILTESSILARSRVSDLANVIKLNVWGCGLNDVAIIKACRNLEVFSASCNEIVSLKELACCVSLQELYVRENQIADMDEVLYLKKLPKLKVLWLTGNPCCGVFGGDDEAYRLWVLKQLPQLERLDNSEVRPEERSKAQNMTALTTTNSLERSQRDSPSTNVPAPNTSSAGKKSPSVPAPDSDARPASVPRYHDQTEAGETLEPSSRSGVTETASQPIYATVQRSSPPSQHKNHRANTSVQPKQEHNHYLPVTPQNHGVESRRSPTISSSYTISPTTIATQAKLRNVNILSAAMSLIKELDSESLQVLQLDIHHRLGDLQSHTRTGDHQ